MPIGAHNMKQHETTNKWEFWRNYLRDIERSYKQKVLHKVNLWASAIVHLVMISCFGPGPHRFLLVWIACPQLACNL